jgi:hypothetical protein
LSVEASFEIDRQLAEALEPIKRESATKQANSEEFMRGKIIF